MSNRFEVISSVPTCGCIPAMGRLPPHYCEAHNRPIDKPENYSPHTSVSDYCPPREAGQRVNDVHVHQAPTTDERKRAVREGIPAILTLGPTDGDGRSVEEIDYSKFPLPELEAGAQLHIHTGKQPDFVRFIENFSKRTTLPTDPAARKNIPITTGVLDYFPAAIAEVAYVSYVGNEKHNPGEDLHHARGKSMDHADCIARHLTERGTIDTVRLPDGREFQIRHSAYVAWRALAMLQEELEAAGAPMARGAR